MKKIIVVSGLPGSGKSTVANGIAAQLGVPVFSVDPIESSILRSGIPRRFETGLAAYFVAETLAAEQLQLGLSVVIDAVNSVQQARDMWRSLSVRFEAQLILIECQLAPEIHRQRIEARVRNLAGIPEVSWEDVETRRKEYLPWQESRLVLDTSASVESCVAEALEYINSQA
jgi:predicted kinase